MRQLATTFAILSLAVLGCAEESRRQTAPPPAPGTQQHRGLTEAPDSEQRVLVAGPAQASPADEIPGSACPVRGGDVQVSATDIEGGIAIELSSEQVPPAELEAHARHLADIESGEMGPGSGPMRGKRPGPRTGMGPGPGQAAGPGPGKAMRQLPASDIKVERTGERVWMTIVAEDPTDTARVRDLGRTAADAMRTAECPLARE